MPDFFVHPQALVETESIGEGTRVWAFAHVMADVVIGRDCNICDHAFIESGVRLGNGVVIKNGVAIWQGVEIADNAFVGPNAVFTNDLAPRSRRLPGMAEHYRDRPWFRKTMLEEGATVGANATIVCGVTLGRFCMIGAGSVVTGDVPPYALAYGAPARVRGYVNRTGDRLEERDGFLVEPETGRKYVLRNNEIQEAS